MVEKASTSELKVQLFDSDSRRTAKERVKEPKAEVKVASIEVDKVVEEYKKSKGLRAKGC